MSVDNITTSGNCPFCVVFTSNINPDTASTLMSSMSSIANSNYDKIHLLLSTPGGSTDSGITLYNFIRVLPLDVITYNIGKVESIGNVVYASGNHRICAPTSSFMLHPAIWKIENLECEPQALKEIITTLQRDQAMISEIIEENTNLDRQTIDALCRKTTILSPQEALECGLVNQIGNIQLPQRMPMKHI